jgi:cytochrome P450
MSMQATSVAPRPTPPGPRRPILGTLIAPRRDPLALFTSYARTYGDVVYFKLSGEPAYLVNHPNFIRDVLVTHQRNFKKSRGLERAKKLLGEGLLTSEGTSHLRSRRLLQPMFHRERIAGYAKVMVQRADQLRARWIDRQTFDAAKEMMRVTLAIVGETLFSTDVESKADEVGVALTQVMSTFFLNLLPGADFIEKLPIPALRRARASRERLDALIYQMIAARRRDGVDHGDLLSTLLETRDEEGAGGLSDQQIRDESMTLLLAGHETTANALTWSWYLLSTHPDAEAKLHDELDRVLQQRLPTMSDLSRLPYLERVVTEALRLYPPAWVIGRRAIGEHVVGEYVVPPRGLVFMSPYIMHRDPRFYDQPDRFNPNRWTPEFKAALPPFAYFPFGGGARKCIGDQFALMETALVLATVAQQWRLRLVAGHPVAPQPLITLRARHGMRMTATRRMPPLRA